MERTKEDSSFFLVPGTMDGEEVFSEVLYEILNNGMIEKITLVFKGFVASNQDLRRGRIH